MQNARNAFHIARRGLPALAVVLAVSVSLPAATMPAALADEMSELEDRVVATGQAYDSAVKERDRLNGEIDRSSTRIADLERTMPKLEKEAAQAASAMYKEQGDANFMLEILLNSTSLADLAGRMEYCARVAGFQAGKLADVKRAKDELVAQKRKLESDRVKSEDAVAQADKAREDAKRARQEALDRAAAKEAEERARASAAVAGGTEAGDLARDIDYSLPKEEFVRQWAPRIDAYLAGRPLAGYGELFASAAYDNGADPRFSPCISVIESGGGAQTFRPYNAWGWMGQSFSSWEEAIPAHIGYISGPVYGNSPWLTPSFAATYCPPGDFWYSAVYAEMKRV